MAISPLERIRDVTDARFMSEPLFCGEAYSPMFAPEFRRGTAN
jgi:hypothetical protein